MNSYEDNGRLYLDMLVFDDDSLYDTYTWVDATMGEVSALLPPRTGVSGGLNTVDVS